MIELTGDSGKPGYPGKSGKPGKLANKKLTI